MSHLKSIVLGISSTTCIGGGNKGIRGKIDSFAAKERTEIPGYLIGNTQSILNQYSEVYYTLYMYITVTIINDIRSTLTLITPQPRPDKSKTILTVW